MRFNATVLQGGKTATGIPVPEEILDALGGGRRPPVRVTVGDHAYRTTVGSRGGRFLLPLSAENREAARVAAGDEVEVTVELDDQPRVVELPADLSAALAEAGVRDAFDALAPSRRKAVVDGVAGAKAAETRARRIDKAVVALA